MGNRLSKIYTKTGDKGETGLASGKRLSKAHPIFEVMGQIDELNSNFGMVKAHISSSNLKVSIESLDMTKSLTVIQHLLFNLGGEIAMTGSKYEYVGIEKKHVDWLEAQIDSMNTELSPLKDFILPSGNQLLCQLHLARSICRRCERRAIDLKINHHIDGVEAVSDLGITFINRLSDWLFVAGRFISHHLIISEPEVYQEAETLWDKEILASVF